ncbi:MAG: NAD-dependent succinate-semialdehyde dehydrogenase [Cyclobacteriaceae bacterium]
MFQSINPFDQSVIAEFPEDDAQTINQKITSAAATFRSWRKESFNHRATLMKRAANLLRTNKNEYALVISTEMGKVLTEATGEIQKCADACDFFADHAEEFLRDLTIRTDASRSVVAFQPLGTVLAIMPWNFPFWQVFRFAVPTLMAGNVGLLKHAGNVSQCSMLIERIFRDAGFPEGTFQSLLVNSKNVEGIIANDSVAAVTLTGSEYAGTQVAAVAGKNLKKTVLELGGSDPFIVLSDADLDVAAKIATQSRMQNAGQSCIAAKRFIVDKTIKESFVERFKFHVEAIRQGNQLDIKTTMGPLARLDLAEDLEKQLKHSVASGARVVTGGNREGANFQPSILDNVSGGMPAFDEELFGPIAAVITVNNEQEAIEMANKNRYGLGASVWTRNPERGERVAREIESGCVFVNSLMRSDQRLPFGGIKKSGYGRELSELGIKEFMNAKSIYIA